MNYDILKYLTLINFVCKWSVERNSADFLLWWALSACDFKVWDHFSQMLILGCILGSLCEPSQMCPRNQAETWKG